jgi:sugar fermentation stimulation protein A
MDGGVYIAIFRLPREASVRVGSLGTVRFRRGIYLYVGSAQRNRAARLGRHARRRKPTKWHVDYLSARATMLGAVLIDGPRRRECELAAELAEAFERPVAGFGASDCRCGGHLFYAPRLP